MIDFRKKAWRFFWRATAAMALVFSALIIMDPYKDRGGAAAVGAYFEACVIVAAISIRCSRRAEDSI
jgi:hypothetical protein